MSSIRAENLFCFKRGDRKLYQQYISLPCSFNDKVQCVGVCPESLKYWRKTFPATHGRHQSPKCELGGAEMEHLLLNPWPLLEKHGILSCQQHILEGLSGLCSLGLSFTAEESHDWASIQKDVLSNYSSPMLCHDLQLELWIKLLYNPKTMSQNVTHIVHYLQ